MRDFVLNDASLPAGHAEASYRWLVDIALAMRALVNANLATLTLRSRRSIGEIQCAPSISLLDACFGLLRTRDQDEAQFLLQLANRSPFQLDLDEMLNERFLRCDAVGCESMRLTVDDGKPLVLCAISGFITVNLPSEPIWDRDELVVVFDELLPDGTIDELKAPVNAISRSSHADAIKARLIAIDRDQVSSYAELWDQRSLLFPDLAFGRDFEGYLKKFDSVWLRKIVRKLTVLNGCANRWKTLQSALPPDPWSSIIKPEGENVQRDGSLSGLRSFKTSDGKSELFMLHTNITKGDRLHLRIDDTERLVEIGYVGPHLRTKKY